MKTGISLCGESTQGKPCSGPVLALYRIAVMLKPLFLNQVIRAISFRKKLCNVRLRTLLIETVLSGDYMCNVPIWVYQKLIYFYVPGPCSSNSDVVVYAQSNLTHFLSRYIIQFNIMDPTLYLVWDVYLSVGGQIQIYAPHLCYFLGLIWFHTRWSNLSTVFLQIQFSNLAAFELWPQWKAWFQYPSSLEQ